MAATADPMRSHTNTSSGSEPVSQHTYHIAGIKVTVHGLSSLPPPAQMRDVAVLWLLHARLQAASSMVPVAESMIRGWYSRAAARSGRKSGLIAVTFDQRNHGSRLIDALANEAWRQGNGRHAPDMFSIYQGTAADVSLLLGHLPGYIFPRGEYKVGRNLALGVSLGGHAAWQCVLHEPEITAAVVVVGCPDYTRLMIDRAAKSKLQSWVQSSPPGKNFVGGPEYPKSLVEQVEKYDPAGLLLGELDVVTGDDWKHEPSDAEKARLYPIMREKLGGKKILCLSGGKDKLVPYECSRPFLTWLKKALAKEGGWFSDRGAVLQDIIDEDAGHEYSPKMVEAARNFIYETLEADDGNLHDTRSAKI